MKRQRGQIKREQDQRISTFRVRGEVRSSTQTTCSVLDKDFVITDQTVIIGKISAGKIATVQGIFKPKIGHVATKIVLSL